MVYLSGVNNQNLKLGRRVSFGGEKNSNSAEQVQKEPAVLMYEEKKNHPIKTGLKIQGNKLKNAFTTYPVKGFQGSKNSNFYEFLTMGIVPYLVGSGMMVAGFNLANRFFDASSRESASKIGRKMAFGVLFYGIAKTLSKKFVEAPVNLKYGIDVNVPYRKKIDELPEERNKDNLVAYEYHKAYESVDFPYWDLFYNNESFGPERNSYFKNVGRKMGFSEEELEHGDQKVKPHIREKLVQTKLFSALSSYLWAAVGVAVAMQEPFENLNMKMLKKTKRIPEFAMNFCKRFGQSCKNFIGSDRVSILNLIVNKCKKQPIDELKKPLASHIAGRLLLASAVGMTLLGNFFTLTDFNKNRGHKPNASASLIDDNKEKVVC